ncbi:serum response factor homolog isoform X2 [Tigriopus californicus]|uniref:serum response factor homolog isoform X2 n=1 Tax=Tigriopus californicus TaxID=6832 RepID=UPI0027DA8EC3|nr:serum response factor homolog isoform X2 [Tigriopus californicus]
MMQSANNGHHGTHPSASSHYPPHLDPRYMDYANMAHHHSSVVDPHLHYLPPSALPQSHLGSGLKRNADSAGLDMMSGTPSSAGGMSSDEDSDVKPPLGERTAGTGRGKSTGPDPATGKKTKGRVKIKMEFIDNKLRRYTTFSKRKTGIMKKAYELSTLTGTQVMLLVASETGHVYTFATRKLQPMITSDAGKALIQTCLNSPDPMPPGSVQNGDQRMSATGYEETELTYNIAAAADEEQQQKVDHVGEESGEGEEESEEGDRDFSTSLNEEEEIEPPPSSIAKPPRIHPKLAFKAQALASSKGKGMGKRSIMGQPPPPPQPSVAHHGTHPIGFVPTNPSASISSSSSIRSVNEPQLGNLIMMIPGPTTTTTVTNMASQSSSRVNSLPPEVKLQLINTGHMVTPEGTLIRIPVPLTTHGPISMVVPQQRMTNDPTMTTAIQRFPLKKPP